MESVFDFLTLFLALIATGCCSGFLAGLLGVGGGIVVVPVLFHVLGFFDVYPAIRMQVAVATSLATIIPTSIVSARSHWRKNSVDRALLWRMAPTVFVGVVVGTLLASIVQGQVLMAVFAFVALLVAIKMALGPDRLTIADQLPGRIGTSVMSGMIGGVSAMMGIGGGTLTVPLLSMFKYPIHAAVGTASALGLIIAVPGAIGFAIAGYCIPSLPPFSFGYVNWAGVLMIVPSSMLAAPWGAHVAHKLSRTRLSQAFGLFLLITAIRMFGGLAWGY